MKNKVLKILKLIEQLVKDKKKPMSYLLALEYKDSPNKPFIILISCLLSLRTRDAVTINVCYKLFSCAQTPEELLKIPAKELEKIFYSLGFYKKKARITLEVSQVLISKFDGKVPDNEKELLSLPGVGRKTANIVLAEAFNKPAIAVDTHVHRLANLFEFVSTKTPKETEFVLRKILPRNLWIKVHRLLVLCGQNKCEDIILKKFF